VTFSLVARDACGAFGSVICSSSPAVAARCVHLADGIGGVHSQNVTDPRLGPAVLEGLRNGLSATAALEAVVADHPHSEFRQLLVVDGEGRAAAHSGTRALGRFSHALDAGVAAGGNMLATSDVPRIMVDAFLAANGELELRLLTALRAAMDVGGEAGPVHSAGLSVVRTAGWRVTDLRVDWDEHDPVAALDGLVERWLPQRDDYVTRALEPSAAPSYGVPGDE
jgi:Uncharacterized conserved protein